jgi:hypothetical protein
MTLIVLAAPSQNSTFHSHPIFTASTVSTLINLQDHCWIKAVQLLQKTPKSYFPHVINQLRAEIRALPWLLYLVAGPLLRRHSFSTRPIQLSVPYRGDTASVPGLSSCRSLTAETQLQSQAYPYRILGGQSGTDTGLSLSINFHFPLSVSFHRCFTIICPSTTDVI